MGKSMLPSKIIRINTLVTGRHSIITGDDQNAQTHQAEVMRRMAQSFGLFFHILEYGRRSFCDDGFSPAIHRFFFDETALSVCFFLPLFLFDFFRKMSRQFDRSMRAYGHIEYKFMAYKIFIYRDVVSMLRWSDRMLERISHALPLYLVLRPRLINERSETWKHKNDIIHNYRRCSSVLIM